MGVKDNLIMVVWFNGILAKIQVTRVLLEQTKVGRQYKSHLGRLGENVRSEFLSRAHTALNLHGTPHESNLGIHLPQRDLQEILVRERKDRIRLSSFIFPFLELPFLEINGISHLVESKFLGCDIDLINETDLLGDGFTLVSVQVVFHLLQQSLRLQLIVAPHFRFSSLLRLHSATEMAASQLRRFILV